MKGKILFFTLFTLLLLILTFNLNANLKNSDKFPFKKQNLKNRVKLKVSKIIEKAPLYFIKNKGQKDKRVHFYAKTKDYTLWITKNELVFDFILKNGKAKDNKDFNHIIKNKRYALRLKFVNHNKNLKIEPIEKTNYRVSYFKGNDKSKWVKDIETFKGVIFKNIYKNIDLKIYGNTQDIEYDWIVKKGGDPEDIEFYFDGVKKTSIDKEGNILIKTKFGEIKHKKPISYQKDENGIKTYIKAYFIKKGKNRYKIKVKEYSKDKELIIDPIIALMYSTYLGGSNYDDGYDIAVDNNGYVYVTGTTYSTDFPTVNEYQGYQAERDIFISKIDTNSSGTSSLLYSTYLGGSDTDFGLGITVDNNGYVYVTGTTYSNDFPTVNEFQGYQGVLDAFVTKIDINSSSLLYSTYLGGSDVDGGNGIAVDDYGCAYITGDTESSDFPLKNQYQGFQGYSDVIVAKIDTNSSGTASLLYSTYLGGSYYEIGYDIFADNNGFAYITGYTSSTDFPTVNEFQGDQAYNDAFISKIDTNSSGAASLLYSTYLGGSLNEVAYGIAVDSYGYVYVTGETYSTDFPTVNEFQGDQGYWDAFITKIDTTSSSLIFSTYLGGSLNEVAYGIAVDSYGYVYVTGETYSTDFPTVNEFQGDQGEWDTFVTKIDTTSSSLLYSTYLGGNANERGNRIVVDNYGYVYIVGRTYSTDFPTVNEYQGDQGEWDAFLVKLDNTLQWKVAATVSGGNGSVSPEVQAVPYGQSASITITPDQGYEIDTITDNGVSKPISNPYTIQSVTEDHNVVVTFKPMITVSLYGERKTERAWTIKKDYGKLTVYINNPSNISYTLVIMRSSNGSNFIEIKRTNSSEITGDSYIFYDKYLEENIKYSYQAIIKDGYGNILSYSGIITL